MASDGATRGADAWTEEAVSALLLNIMKQTNPTLAANNWKAIAEAMRPYGFNQNVLQKKFIAIRKQFNGKPESAASGATTSLDSTLKRKRGKNENIPSATTAKKARTKAPATAVASDDTEKDADEEEENTAEA